MKPLLLIIGLLFFVSCSKNEDGTESKSFTFGQPQKVTLNGYSDDLMEPFLSRDGKILFFNNLNDPSVNTNLHFARLVDSVTFAYQGELIGVNTSSLEGVASMDNSNRMYFVSTRSYNQTLSTIYRGDYSTDSVTGVQLVSNLSKNLAGWVNFDVEVSHDGNDLYFVDGRFDENGGPYEADLRLAVKRADGTFERTDNSILKNVNTSGLEYAACISADQLELYFTRVDVPISATSVPQIFVATRNFVGEPFNQSYKINEITGFVEAPTISPDDRAIYYHKNENGKFVLYRIQKK